MTEPERITYPFPLRPGVVAELRLPSDLTLAEAKRLSGFLASLALAARPGKRIASNGWNHSVPLFRIDMNSVKGNWVGTLVSHHANSAGQTPPAIGDLVAVIDEEENQCGAKVVDRFNDWIGLELLWDTWSPSAMWG